MKKLRVLFVPTANAGVQFYRFWTFAVAMHRNNLADVHHLWYQKGLTEAHPWENEVTDYNYMWRITKEMQDYAIQSDVVVFQMLHTEAGLGLFRALREMMPHLTILSEIDDHMTSTPTYNPADPYYAPGESMRKIAIDQFKESDGLIVSTPYLKEVYSEFNENIVVIQNSMDFQIWNGVRNKPRPGIRIGWAGGSSHEEDLRIMEPVIKSLVEKYGVEFVFVHGLPHFLRGLKGVTHVRKWTRIDKYPAFLASQDFDIGIAPLVDNAFNRGKSNLRWLEYSSLGIPTVASKVGHFSETIRHGVDGFLAEDAGAFEMYLGILIREKARRKLMGGAARDRIFKDFNTDKTAQEYVRVLGEFVANKKPPEVLS